MPWAAALYAADGAYWDSNGGRPAKAGPPAPEEFVGRKFVATAVSRVAYPDIRQVRRERKVDRLLFDQVGVIGDGGNSGFQALNLLAQFTSGKVPIVLVGIDCRLDYGRHWHADHRNGLNNPDSRNVIRWRNAFNGLADELADRGIEVYRASELSSLVAYPVLSVSQAIERFCHDDHAANGSGNATRPNRVRKKLPEGRRIRPRRNH